MNPQYYVRTAPRHPDPRYAFSAFSIRPAQAELFDVAHVILLAEAVMPAEAMVGTSDPPLATQSSHRALVLIRRMMQQEVALPVVRRLVEALRQANMVLYNENQGARIIAGILVKNTLYVTCVGAMGAYVIRNEKVASLLQAERTHDSYLGRTLQLQLDYQMPTAAALFAESHMPHAYLITDRFLLAPGDSLIFCSTEVPLTSIKPALLYTSRPERLAAAITQTMAQRTGQTPGVIALHWRVDRVAQAVKQLLLVLFIFFCVTAAMQSVIFVNQRVDRWFALHSANNNRTLPPILYGASAALAGDAVDPAATTTAHTAVQVNVDVNVDAAPPLNNQAVVVPLVTAVVPVLAVVDTPVVAESVALATQPTPTAIELAEAAIVQPTDLLLSVPLVRSAVAPLPSDTPSVLATPTLSLLSLLPVADTPINTAPPTATAIATMTPTAPPTATSTLLPTLPPKVVTAAPTATATVAPAPTVVEGSLGAVAVPAEEPGVTLLAPPEQTSSSDLMTFVWQSHAPLPVGEAYEVIVWRPGQTPLTEGLGVAPPTQEQSLAVQLRGLYQAGVIQPGPYNWGILHVTVAPYTRLALLSGERTFYFDGPDQGAKCNPDRESC